MSSNDGQEVVNNELLEGHLGITRELLSYQSSQKKFLIGSKPDGHNLLKVSRRSMLMINASHLCNSLSTAM